MSQTAMGCGAYQISVQGGWALGLRCGQETILGKGDTLAAAVQSARTREQTLRTFYQPLLESCHQLVAVAPDGIVVVPQPLAIASDSGP